MKREVHELIMAVVSREVERQEILQEEGRFDFTPKDAGTKVRDELVLAMLMEEVGEVSKELLGINRIVEHGGSWNNLRTELVQVAAISVAWLEALEFVEENGSQSS